MLYFSSSLDLLKFVWLFVAIEEYQVKLLILVP